jgi:hypothetical protein
MIYMVACRFADPALEPAWNDWYSGHLPTLLSVPGIETAQRFRQRGVDRPRYRAVYTLTSPAVFESDAYRNKKGGRFPPEWRENVVDHSRDILAGLDVAPAVAKQDMLVVFMAKAAAEQMAVAPDWLTPAGLDRSVPLLGLAAVDASHAALSRPQPEGVEVYEVLTDQKSKASEGIAFDAPAAAG